MDHGTVEQGVLLLWQFHKGLATMTEVPSSCVFHPKGWLISPSSTKDWNFFLPTTGHDWTKENQGQIMGSSTLLLPDAVVWRRCELQMRQRLFAHINAAFQLINAFRIADFCMVRSDFRWYDWMPKILTDFSHTIGILLSVFEGLFQTQLRPRTNHCQGCQGT